MVKTSFVKIFYKKKESDMISTPLKGLIEHFSASAVYSMKYSFFFFIRIIAKTGLLLIYHFFDVYFYCDASCNQTILTRLLLFYETPTGNRALL